MIDPRDEELHRLPPEEPDDDTENYADEELDEEVDARPADQNDSLPPVHEPGLSVDPEDLGKEWLAAATDQSNFESSLQPEEDGMHIVRLPKLKVEEE